MEDSNGFKANWLRIGKGILGVTLGVLGVVGAIAAAPVVGVVGAALVGAYALNTAICGAQDIWFGSKGNNKQPTFNPGGELFALGVRTGKSKIHKNTDGIIQHMRKLLILMLQERFLMLQI